MKNKSKIIILIVLILGTLGLWLKIQSKPSPNILLITVDSLRPDHLSCYGYSRNTSPNIDKLARQGVIFTQAIAQASWTVPSMASLVTSMYPSTHGIRTWDATLPARILTLAKILKPYGYYSFFCSGHNQTLSEILGLAGGFDEWTTNDDLINAIQVNEYALKFLNKNYKRKFFLWMHYMDVHDHFNKIGKDQASSLSAFEKTENINNYDLAIARIDQQIGIIIAELRKLRIDNNTLIIISADHGEEMCEHGICFNHGGFLWDPLIRVPLIMVWKNSLPGNFREPDQVQHIDIAPSVCDILKIKQPLSFEGQSLLPIISGRKNILRPAFSEHYERVGDRKDGAWVFTRYSIRSNNWKLICNLYPTEEGCELYNLKNDPGELIDLAVPEKAKFEFFLKELEVWRKRNKSKVMPLFKTLNQGTKDRLRSLGYLQ